MITQQEKSILTTLLRDPSTRVIWDTLQKLAQDKIDRLRRQKPDTDTQWKLIKSALGNDFEIKGIKDLFNEIENYVK